MNRVSPGFRSLLFRWSLTYSGVSFARENGEPELLADTVASVGSHRAAFLVGKFIKDRV